MWWLVEGHPREDRETEIDRKTDRRTDREKERDRETCFGTLAILPCWLLMGLAGAMKAAALWSDTPTLCRNGGLAWCSRDTEGRPCDSVRLLVGCWPQGRS